jgi:hypothetical protein
VVGSRLWRCRGGYKLKTGDRTMRDHRDSLESYRNRTSGGVWTLMGAVSKTVKKVRKGAKKAIDKANKTVVKARNRSGKGKK